MIGIEQLLSGCFIPIPLCKVHPLPILDIRMLSLTEVNYLPKLAGVEASWV